MLPSPSPESPLKNVEDFVDALKTFLPCEHRINPEYQLEYKGTYFVGLTLAVSLLHNPKSGASANSATFAVPGL
jgi:hypothetical protein